MFDGVVSFLRYLFSGEKDFKRKIKKITGFFPDKNKYYKKALIHRSASIINKKGEIVNNERLEYLGDAVLDAIIGDFLFRKYPEADEGFLTQTRSKLVNRNTLHDLAKKIKLHRLIILNNTNNISKKNIYGDAFEAFIGAIYLDKGFKKTYKFIIEKIVNKLLNIDSIVDLNDNYKSILIEWAQKFKKAVVFYTDLESGSSKYFISYVRIENQNIGEGIGLSKKDAEQKAARNALEAIKNNPELHELTE